MYPLADSTNLSDKVLFNPNTDTFPEDFTQEEYLREQEDIIRFNSIIKSPGIVAKKAEVTLRLYPTVTVQPDTIKITAGVGFTKNGSKLILYDDLVINDMTALEGWQDPGALVEGYYEYLVLKKITEDYLPRPNRITGVNVNSRQRNRYNWTSGDGTNSIVQWVVAESPSDVSQDCVILARISGYDDTTFVYTETDGRVILREGEIPYLELTGGTMQGDIDGNNRYTYINSPQFGATYWKINGSPNNYDFHRLFAKVNHTLFVRKGIKFEQSDGLYGITFSSNTDVKLTILPNQQPPQKIDINNSGFYALPANNVMYLVLTNEQMLLGGSGGIPVGTLPDSIQTFTNSDFLNTRNVGIDVGASLHRFPICWHYVPPSTSEHYLIFSNGQILKLNESIDDDGKYSGYVRTDGGNYMTGNLRIIKTAAKVTVKHSSSTAPAGESKSGYFWENSLSTQITRLARYDAINSEDTTNEVGDVELYLTDSLGSSTRVVFKNDGRVKVSDPTEDYDAINLHYAVSDLGFVRKTGDTMTGTLWISSEGLLKVGSSTTTPGRIEPRVQLYGDVSIYYDSLHKANLNVDGTTNIGEKLFVGGDALFYDDVTIGQLLNKKNFNVYGININFVGTNTRLYGNVFVEDEEVISESGYFDLNQRIKNNRTKAFFYAS